MNFVSSLRPSSTVNIASWSRLECRQKSCNHGSPRGSQLSGGVPSHGRTLVASAAAVCDLRRARSHGFALESSHGGRLPGRSSGCLLSWRAVVTLRYWDRRCVLSADQPRSKWAQSPIGGWTHKPRWCASCPLLFLSSAAWCGISRDGPPPLLDRGVGA